MMFDTLPKGAKIFIDANIFVYHFGELSPECKTLLSGCARRELRGYTSTSVVAEILHRLMLVEAVKKGYISAKNPVKQVKAHPDIIAKLSDYSLDVATIHAMHIKILSLTDQHLRASEAIRKTEGLLTNDSLILAVMQSADLTKLATNDRDFERVSWLDLYGPTDI